ncbi:MAG: transcriptional regulator GutM [Lachnospiraceae bacterium]|nr:transcriptional regulator GutM [Lachnospiraceae bacterium]
MNAILKIFVALFLIYLLQSFLSVFQIRAYQKALRESRSLGTIGVGQKKAKFGIIKGNIVIIGCNREGVITGGQIMEGITLFARFKPLKEIIEKRPIVEGETIYDYLTEFRSMTQKEQNYYKGFIQALEAIEMRFAYESEDAFAAELNAAEDMEEDFDIDDL